MKHSECVFLNCKPDKSLSSMYDHGSPTMSSTIEDIVGDPWYDILPKLELLL